MHQLTDSPQAISIATEMAIQDFADDNVIYLELRTTPRSTENMTKEQYITAVIESILYLKIHLYTIRNSSVNVFSSSLIFKTENQKLKILIFLLNLSYQ